MTQTVLILGATGRFGRHAAQAFEAAGWSVRRFDRKTDDLDTMARGVDVIVNAWNPLYSKWNAQVMAMQPAVHKAALANDATVIIPGNVYVFGAQTPGPWSDATPHGATNLLGRIRIEMEASYREAGVRTIVLRAGDYLDTAASGNWFDKILAPSLSKGALTYPGPKDSKRVWAFLPDVARAAVLLAEKRDGLERFTDICFPGYCMTGEEMAAHLARARGHDVRIKPMPWWALRLVQPFWAEVKHLFEMRYLWQVEHRLDGTAFERALPRFDMTDPQDALGQAADFVPLPKPARKLRAASA